MSKPQALCLPTTIVDDLLYSVGTPRDQRGFIPMGALTGQKFWERLGAHGNNAWMIPRVVCETDPEFLQLLPYVIVQMPNQKLLGYNRPTKGGGEQRLAGNFSIGIGGHVEFPDIVTGGQGLKLCETLHVSARREISEEIHLLNTQSVHHTRLHLAGVIRSEDAPVDTVHLGLVFIMHLEAASPDAVCRASAAEPDQIINLRELKVSEARAEAQPESWTAKILASGLLDTWGKK